AALTVMCVATTVPMIAMPSEPPTWRMLLITAGPTPALSTGTDPIAAAVVGAIVIAIPNPPASRPGRMFQNDDCASIVPNRSSDPVSSVIPATIGQRGPIRSLNRPANGATRMISSVIGRNVAPVLIAL